MKKFLLLLLSFLTTAHFQGFSREGATTIPSILRSATVYRTGAELTHTAKTFLRQGNNELIIEDISNNIDINSLRIGTTETVTILSVEFSKEYLRPETRSPPDLNTTRRPVSIKTLTCSAKYPTGEN